MYQLKRALADAVLEAAQRVYPQEFICMIGSKKNNQLLDDLVLVPSTFGDSFSQIQYHHVPLDPTIKGSIHSHPSYSAQPSTADKNAFRKMGSIHLIISYPYTYSTIKMYNSQGEPLEFELVD